MKETRVINYGDLRNLCIQRDWYTFGDNDAYADLLDFAASHEMSTENLIKIANDIIEHTNPQRFADCEVNGMTPLRYVLFELAETCHTFFHEEDEAFRTGLSRRGE